MLQLGNGKQIEMVRPLGRMETPPTFAQLGVVIQDQSGSASEITSGNITKSQATCMATREMFDCFQTSRAGKNFSFAVVTFDTEAKLQMPITPVGKELVSSASSDPFKDHGGGTHIFRGLEKGGDLASEFARKAVSGGVPHDSVLLLMSDGCCQEPDKTRRVAAQLKRGVEGSCITICCAYFATPGEDDSAAQNLLREIASDPVRGFTTVYDGESLRKFFTSSMSMASGGIKMG